MFFVAGHWPLDGVYVHALDAATGEAVWTTRSMQYRPYGVAQAAGGKLFVYGHGGTGAYDTRSGRAVPDKAPRLVLPEPAEVPEGIEGGVASSQIHGDRQLVVTTQGKIYCFARRITGVGSGEPSEKTDGGGAPEEAPTYPAAKRIIEKTGVEEGYALVLGLDDGALVEGLLRGSALRVIAVDEDEKKADATRHRLDVRGLFDDHRLGVYTGKVAELGLPPYMASLITSETNLTLTEKLREHLRPYGGTFAVVRGEKLTIERRNGPVEGSGEWTHEYGDAGNVLSSEETVARAPLGTLWYEGPASAARFYFDGLVDHQSGHGVSPLPPGAEIVEGRMLLQGPGRLGAFDIYTGRLLWETELPEVYGFGGPGGGVGVHSRQHREPWKYEPAMKAEIPATHHSRTTGLNFASARDGIYVCAGSELLCFHPDDGSQLSAWHVPLPEPHREKLCWGSVRVSGDRVVATAFRPRDLVDAQCGHDGNGGEWSKDRMPMTHLLTLDRKTGKLLWSRRAELGFLNRGIAVGRSTIFCVDTIAPHTLEKFRERKRTFDAKTPMVYALDLATGKTRWQFDPGVLVTNLTYAQRRDTLLVPCRNLRTWQDGRWGVEGGGSEPSRNAPGRMWAIRGKDGKVLWEIEGAPYSEPHAVIGDMILDRYCFTHDIESGQRNRRVSPLTGESETWHFRKGGCNHLVGCPTLITWRTAFYDLAGHSGSMPLLGMNMGCTATMLPAGGVLNVPAYGTHHKRSRMTALALVHRPDNPLWTGYHTSREKVTQPVVPLRRAGFNLGAPGDRLSEDGTLWLSVTSRKTENLELTPKEAGWFQIDPPRAGSWITASGATGMSELAIPMIVTTDKNARRDDDEIRCYDVRLHFAEPEPIKPGQRVFSVSLEGKTVLENLDVVRVAGGRHRPLVRELRGVEIQGPLNVSCSALKGTPLLCGIEVITR